MMESRNVALPLHWVLLAVRSQSVRAMLFLPSMHTPSERLETSCALATETSAVE